MSAERRLGRPHGDASVLVAVIGDDADADGLTGRVSHTNGLLIGSGLLGLEAPPGVDPEVGAARRASTMAREAGVHLVARQCGDGVDAQRLDARGAAEQRLARPALRRATERQVVAAIAEVTAYSLLVLERALAEMAVNNRSTTSAGVLGR